MEGVMSADHDLKVMAITSVKNGNQEIRIEKLFLEPGEEKIRLSSWSGGAMLPQPLILSEAELIEILHQAFHTGVLPLDFIAKLKEKIEI
jgi:hypothetical protein